MSLFGKTAFSGSRFIFWTLAPVLIVCAVMSGFFTCAMVPEGKLQAGVIGAVVTFSLLCGILMFFNPQRFSWAGRVVTGAIFAAYLAYAIDEWFFTDHDFGWDQSRSATTPRNALAGLICIGLPCLWFTLRGRFSRTAEPEPVRRPRPPGLPEVEVLGMARRVERPLRAEEIAELKAASVFRGPTASRLLLWGALWSGLTVGVVWSFLVLLAGADHGPPTWMSNLIPVCFLGSILTFYAAYLCFRAGREASAAGRRFAKVIAPRLHAALADGRASVVGVETRSVIEIEEEEGEGSVWLFALADGTTFYLRGADYFPAEEKMPWPAKEFQIVRAAVNDEWIGLFSKGAQLEPELRVAAEEMPEDFVWAEHPASESILAGPPMENLRRLGYESSHD